MATLTWGVQFSSRAVNKGLWHNLLTHLLTEHVWVNMMQQPLRWLFNKLLSKSAKLTRPQFSTSKSMRFMPGCERSMITWSCIVQSTVSTASPFTSTCHNSPSNQQSRPPHRSPAPVTTHRPINSLDRLTIHQHPSQLTVQSTVSTASPYTCP